MVNESEIERHFKQRLESFGFKVLKLYTPGTTAAMDRMILRPRYSPGVPRFVELKRPGKKPTPIQARTADDWRERGCEVLKPISSMAECDQLCTDLITEVMPDYAFSRRSV